MGNPSDGYGGKAIAMTLANFRAAATIEPSGGLELVASDAHRIVLPTLADAAEPFVHSDGDDGLRLMRAALRRFLVRCPELPAAGPDPRACFVLRFETDIPRLVGLSGSSAIVIAVLRALMAWFNTPIAPAEIAEMALAAELEDLGIACGAMDRVIQAYEGVVEMDLSEPRSDASYARVDPALLPPLFVAFDPRGGEASGDAHGALRARWKSGDPELAPIITRFRELVDSGVDALRRHDHARFGELMNENFDLRTSFFPVSDRDLEMVRIARRLAVSGKLCGSGGAIVGQLRDPADGRSVRDAFHERGFRFVEPRLGAA